MDVDREHHRLAASPERDYAHERGEVERHHAAEIERRNAGNRSLAALAAGGSGLSAAGVLGLTTLLAGPAPDSALMLLTYFVATVVAGLPSAWLAKRGADGLLEAWESRPARTPALRTRGYERESGEKGSERELLEVIERRGEITPARAALETSLSVEEAERKLSGLAEKGHLEVRAEGGRLVYAL